MRRVCPACANRTARLIDPACPVCHGQGVLTLHPAALAVYDGATVSEAVTIAVEAIARSVDTSLSLSDDQVAALTDRINELEAAGIIRTHTPKPATADNVRSIRRQCTGQATLAEAGARPVMVAAEYGPETPTLFDATLAGATPWTYKETDRPMMRGLPVLSANGHPSSLARITDPVDQLVGTGTGIRERTKQLRQAHVLLESVPAAIKGRKKRKTA